MTDDTISRQGVLRLLNAVPSEESATKAMLISGVKAMPSAQPESFEWCHDCKEYDQTEHCCHRWTKVIRQTVEELKAQPERKKGTWRHYEGMLTCSVCGAEFYDEIMEYLGGDVPRFCPDCGADMRGDDHGTD